MAPKKDTKKREADAAAEDAAKKAKTEETKAEEPKKPEFKEEEDAADINKPGIKDTVAFNVADTTINTIPTHGGKVLVPLADGGMQYLIAGARANVGVKKGRYMFEVKALQSLNSGTSEGGGDYGKGKRGKGGSAPGSMVVRIGFSTAGSSLVLGDIEESICFDNDGNMFTGKSRTRNGQSFSKGMAMAVVLNLDSSSPHANTISLFKNGLRVTQPRPLPESLVGKTLFPHVAFRNAVVQVNFGPSPLQPLPFKCKTVQGAAPGDVEVVKSSPPKDGKYEVVFPVGFPDEGTFDWLDMWLEDKPDYTELSDRKVIEWAKASGLHGNRGGGGGSNDAPTFSFGISQMDDKSLCRQIQSMAALVPRNYVVMQVKSNLVADERKNNLKKFSGSQFKKIAQVVMGEPTSKEFKKRVQQQILKKKQDKSDNAWRTKKAAQERKKAEKERAKKQKEAAEKRKQEAEERRKKAEEAKKKAAEAEAKAKKEAEDKKAGDEKKDDKAEEKKEEKEEKKEEPKVEEKKEEKKEEPKAEEKDDDEEMEDLGTEPPKVELDADERKIFFAKKPRPDLEDRIITQSFAKFSVPEKSEGFDEVKFEWQDAKKATAYLRQWVLDKKKSTRVEDLVPGKDFVAKLAEFNKTFQEFKTKQTAFKAKAKPKKADDADAAADTNIMEAKDVNDIGNGEPLYANFGFEDWALLSLRYELYLVMKSFTTDVNDEDRPGIPENHFLFYFQKYLKKSIAPKSYGKENLADLFTLIKDTVAIEGENNILACKVEDTDSLDIFVKLAEGDRRERQRRLDAGDESGRLKFEGLKDGGKKEGGAKK